MEAAIRMGVVAGLHSGMHISLMVRRTSGGALALPACVSNHQAPCLLPSFETPREDARLLRMRSEWGARLVRILCP